MAAQGGVLLQEKISRLLNRQGRKPDLKPNRPLVLKDGVADRRPPKGEATCITEMSVLMACWKQNNFMDNMCSNQISSFYTCVAKAQAAVKNKSERSNVQGGRLPPKQANTLLRRYPNLQTEI